ncbi:FMN-binding negative transcriptional regulator [Actinomadura sp. WMMB 499]|uniref:FMN-binding negative transcriptional regulator n=1 Tax=Actinomadura sp. WMMB 499 TaxID=1219491 RepID=UPI0012484BEA|nr:FMN-binding negative transcriptional regulator [Actinomadura sp. WMMB 499]QFG25675.1 FMN-binding negative transcriptional regulator [Actinomadura sp. WMMB 499]
MYAFPRFTPDDPRHAVELVRDHPFALAVSAPGGVPVATHLPVIIEDPAEVGDTFAGTTLLGHMARVNPHWRDMAASPEALLVFSGPHGYVSPSMHGADPSVPTWDYAAVHLNGTVEPITDEAGVLDVVERTVAVVEARRSPGWTPSEKSREVFRSIVSGVVAFRFHVREQQSIFKLSQDRISPWDRIHDAFSRGPDANPELAGLMREIGCPAGSGRE